MVALRSRFERLPLARAGAIKWQKWSAFWQHKEIVLDTRDYVDEAHGEEQAGEIGGEPVTARPPAPQDAQVEEEVPQGMDGTDVRFFVKIIANYVDDRGRRIEEREPIGDVPGFHKFVGHAALNLNTPMGPIHEPFTFGIDAVGPLDAFDKFDATAQETAPKVIDHVKQRINAMQEAESRRIVTPGAGGAPAGGPRLFDPDAR